jgi:AraC-like DNA-binding protein
MSLIATLLPQATQVQRLRAALRDRHVLRECGDWSSLARACEREAVRLAVVDLFAGAPVNFESIRHLKRRLPRLTLVAYVAMSAEHGHALFDAGRAGVDGLVLAGEDDAPRPLLALIERAESSSLAGMLRRSLEGIEPMVVDAVLLSVARAHERLSPATLARLLAAPRRVITARLAAAGFPPPQRLLTWGRLVLAAHMLEDDHRSADRVASTLDFPSGSAFRNACQRYLRATPTEIRERGGASYVVRIMLRHVNARVATATEPAHRASRRSPAVAL